MGVDPLTRKSDRWKRLTASLAVRRFLPLRYWLYLGDVSWTEDGRRFSWRMKLRD